MTESEASRERAIGAVAMMLRAIEAGEWSPEDTECPRCGCIPERGDGPSLAVIESPDTPKSGTP